MHKALHGRWSLVTQLGEGDYLHKLVLLPQKEHLLEFLACWPLLGQKEGV